MVTLETINETLESFGKKFDQIDEKIDDLAAMTARGFMELKEEFKSDLGAIEDRLEIIEENYVTKADLVNFTRLKTIK